MPCLGDKGDPGYIPGPPGPPGQKGFPGRPGAAKVCLTKLTHNHKKQRALFNPPLTTSLFMSSSRDATTFINVR